MTPLLSSLQRINPRPCPRTAHALQYSLYPQLAKTTPFVVPVPVINEIIKPYKPPKTDYLRTYELGSKTSAKRSQYDTDSAWFWAQGANTSTVMGMWLDIAREVLPKDLSLTDTALFFARTGVAAYDASIAGWKVRARAAHASKCVVAVVLCTASRQAVMPAGGQCCSHRGRA